MSCLCSLFLLFFSFLLFLSFYRGRRTWGRSRVLAKAEFTNPIPQKIRRTKKYCGIPQNKGHEFLNIFKFCGTTPQIIPTHVLSARIVSLDFTDLRIHKEKVHDCVRIRNESRLGMSLYPAPFRGEE